MFLLKLPAAIIKDIFTGGGMVNESNLDGYTYTTRLIKNEFNYFTVKSEIKKAKKINKLLSDN